jgi:AAT family amino acid transporter
VKVSPFVLVFKTVGIPKAPSLMNFVVLTAALSGANSSLYAATRMLYSIADVGLAPRMFRRVSGKGVPLVALLGSAVGLAVATLAAIFIPARAFVFMLAAAYFQIIFVWLAILLSYMVFRHRARAGDRPLRALKGHPYSTVAAIGLLAAILITTWWIPSMKVTLVSGVIWLAVASAYYALVKGRTPAMRS